MISFSSSWAIRSSSISGTVTYPVSGVGEGDLVSAGCSLGPQPASRVRESADTTMAYRILFLFMMFLARREVGRSSFCRILRAGTAPLTTIICFCLGVETVLAGLRGSFLRRKGGRGFLGLFCPAAGATRPEPPGPMRLGEGLFGGYDMGGCGWR